MALWAEGKSKKDIALETGIPRSSVVSWIKGTTNLSMDKTPKLSSPIECLKFLNTGDRQNSYIYLLGAYLGDGYISKGARTHRLRISCSTKQPFVIASIKKALLDIFPDNDISEVDKNCNCLDVSVYSTLLPYLFPQMGAGMKHSRPILLEGWQKELLDGREPLLLKGLFHSDGSFYIAKQQQRCYYRYQFTNTSADIITLFKDCLEKLKIEYGVVIKNSRPCPISKAHRPTKQGWNILIRKIEEVKKFYRICGTKYNEIIPELL